MMLTITNQFRIEKDALGVVQVPEDRLWGAQTQRSLEHFSIGKDLIPTEMITAYAILKKAAAIANHAGKRLGDQQYKLIVQTCDEILAGKHHDMFPLHVWMTGSGTQFNMNVNENEKKINEYVQRSLMLVTALAPVIGYDKASKIAHHAMENDLTLKAAALQLGFVSEVEFDRIVDPRKMVRPYVGK